RAPHELPGNPDARMTPAVRRLLREHGLTAGMIVGTGGGGRIPREDVTDYVESQRTGKPVGRQDSAAAPSNGQTPTASGAPASGPVSVPMAPAPAGSAPSGPTAAPQPARPATAAGGGIEFPEGADEVLVP